MILPYCDYMAHIIQKNLKKVDENGLIDTVGKVHFDLNPDGSYRSPKKTISIVDVHGTTYTVTIEETRNDNKV